MTIKARHVALFSSLGAGLEYYDFIIYGMMAENLGILFFSEDEPWLALIKAFAIFAVGYLMRPVGGLLFGVIGDTFGRKKPFLSVMLLMSIATFGIGLLPTYAEVGALAPCLLVVLRLLQGLSFGAELPGAMTVVCEYAKKQNQGIYSSFVIASTSIGAMLASFVLYVLTKNIDKGQILAWGWRLPFLFGGVLAIVSYYIRRHLDETPEFSKMRNQNKGPIEVKTPLVYLFYTYPSKVIKGICMTFFVSSLVIGALYFPTYLSVYFGYDPADIYLAILCSLGWSAFIMPFCGYLSDRIEKRSLLMRTATIFILCAFPLFLLLYLHSFTALLLFLLIYQTFLAFVSCCYFPLIVNLFPTQARFSGVGFCYNSTYSIVALLPLFLTMLITWTGQPSCMIWILILTAFTTYVLKCYVPDTESSKI